MKDRKASFLDHLQSALVAAFAVAVFIVYYVLVAALTEPA